MNRLKNMLKKKGKPDEAGPIEKKPSALDKLPEQTKDFKPADLL